MKKFIALVLSIALPVGIGYLSSFFTKNSTDIYTNLELPLFAPPANVFPIVWSILFVLMGISFFLILTKSRTYTNNHAYTLYFVQLFFNFTWSILFFRFNLYLVAFFWLVALIFIVYKMLFAFYELNHLSAYLQVPYLFWLVFAGYLNLSIVMLN